MVERNISAAMKQGRAMARRRCAIVMGNAAALAAAELLWQAPARADWLQTSAGTYEYNDPNNWVSGNIDDVFPSSLTIGGAQTITFNADRTLSGDWQFLYGGTGDLTLRGDGTNRVVTLSGNLTLDSQSDARTVTFGSGTANQNLSVALGSTVRTFNVGTGDTAMFMNALTGGMPAGNVSIIKSGAGKVSLRGTNSTFTGNIRIDAGTFELVQNIGNATNSAILGALGNDITLNGGTLRADTSMQASGVLGSGHTITVNNVAGNTIDTPTRLNIGGANNLLTGSGALLKIGAGDLNLTGTNNYSGAMTVQQGTLQLRISGALGSSATINLTGGSVGISTGSSDNTFNSPVNVSANTSFTVSKNGSSQAGGVSTFGALSVGSQTMTFGTNGNLTSGTATAQFANTTLTGSPTFNQNNGTVVVQLNLNGVVSDGGSGLGFTKGGTGWMRLSGTTANTYAGLTRVNSGILILDKSANVVAVPGNLLVSATAAASVRIQANEQISDSSAVTLQGTSTSVRGTLDLNGLTETIGTLADGTNSFGRVSLTSATTAGTLIVGNSTSTTFSGLIQDVGATAGGSVTKQGSGMLTLGGDNSYTGITTVNAGTLAITGTTSGQGNYSVAGPGTLSGTGTIGLAPSKVITVNGTVAPGVSAPGVLTATGAPALTFASASGSTPIFSVELDGPTPGVGAGKYDQLKLLDAAGTADGGTVDLGIGVSELRVALLYTPDPSQTFTILTAGAITGTFANAPVNGGTFVDSVNGTSGTITYNATSIVLSNVAVPEPATFGLLGAMTMGFLGRRRRHS